MGVQGREHVREHFLSTRELADWLRLVRNPLGGGDGETPRPVTTVVSNRGPYRFVQRADGGFDAHRGVGGLAGALGPLLMGGAAGPNSTWVAAAIDDDDRAAVHADAVDVPGICAHAPRRRSAAVPPLLRPRVERNAVVPPPRVVRSPAAAALRRADSTRRGRRTKSVNRAFADATLEQAGPGDAVLVQDYHLALVPGMLRAERPDLRVIHFTHTAFCGPNSARVLPSAVAVPMFESMAGGRRRIPRATLGEGLRGVGPRDSRERRVRRPDVRRVARPRRGRSALGRPFRRSRRRTRRARGLDRRSHALAAGRPARSVEEHRPGIRRVRHPAELSTRSSASGSSSWHASPCPASTFPTTPRTAWRCSTPPTSSTIVGGTPAGSRS